MKSSLGLVLVFTAISGIQAYNRLYEIFISKAAEIRSLAEQYLAYNHLEAKATPDYPYWNFMPETVTSLKVDKSVPESWSTDCFKSNKASVSRSSDGKNLNVKITSSDASSSSCSDNYLIGTTSAVDLCTTIKPSKIGKLVTTEVTLTIPEDVTEAELWDIDTKGVRIFRFLHDKTQLVSNLLRTVELFGAEATLGVPPKVAEANIDFLTKYSRLDIQPRDAAENNPPDESEVHSGDAFYVMRLDGLNPMLAWAMGSTTGHVTTAMWIDGALYVCESTTDSAYWPTDWIQRTPYQTWLTQTAAADMQVVWAPLSETARANYNETAASEFFKSVEGNDYGYKTLLWGWIDTQKENFPCVPSSSSDFSNCLTWEVLEVLLPYVDRLIPEVGDLIWNPGYAKRINAADGQRTSTLFKLAADAGLTSNAVITIPENDNWLYNMTRYDEPAVGKNMVCCVFVCNTWKAAGVFGDLADNINCGELTNWDDYVLTIHADTYRQIVGTYTLKLNDFKTKTPYAHMAETCASKNPDYEKSATC